MTLIGYQRLDVMSVEQLGWKMASKKPRFF